MATKIGTGPEDIPLNQFLGQLAFEDVHATNHFQVLASDPATGVVGECYYNSTVSKLKVYDGTAWTTLGTTVSNDPGAGGGFSIAAGADNTAATLTSTSTTMYNDSWIDSQGASGTPLDYSTGSFAFHTGHNQNSTQCHSTLLYRFQQHQLE